MRHAVQQSSIPGWSTPLSQVARNSLLRGAAAVAIGMAWHTAVIGQTATICGVEVAQCNANDIFREGQSFKVDPAASVPSCAYGETVQVPVSVLAGRTTTNANRYSLGVEYESPASGQCVREFAPIGGPTNGFDGPVSGFSSLNGDTVGDLRAGGTSAGYINFTVPVLCQPDAQGRIALPAMLGFGSNNEKRVPDGVAANPTPKCYASNATYAPTTVTGVLTIKKDTVGGDASFPFAVSGGSASPASFSLSNGGSQDVRVTLSSAATTYTIRETLTGAWQLQAPVCHNLSMAGGCCCKVCR